MTRTQAADRLWSSSAGSAWLTASNWTSSIAPTAIDNAQFGANPTSIAGAGINFNSTTNAGTQTNGLRIQEVGAIELSSARTGNPFLIGNSSSTVGANGTLRLMGTTVNGISDVILRNNSSQHFTIKDTQGAGNQTMDLSLGSSTENKIVVDGSGNIVVSSMMKSNAGTTPLTITGAGSGRVDITNGANTFTGNIKISGSEVRIAADGSLGHAANDIFIDGGRFATANTANFTLGAGRDVFLGDTAGTAISTTGLSKLVIQSALTNISGKTGALVKQGAGSLELRGTSTYTGTTIISEGTLLIAGNHTGGADYTVGSAGAIGGDGTIGSSLHFESGAEFVFDPFHTLTVNGGTVTFANFSITDLIGLNGSIAAATYTLIDGSADVDFTNIINKDLSSAASIGGGKLAYFQSGSLRLVVIPEPSVLLLGVYGLFALLLRRR